MRQKFALLYILLLVAQIILCNYFNFSAYIMLSILPVLILCLPTSVNTLFSLLIAFVSGLTVDYLSEGILGLNTLALVPVAYCRLELIKFIFGEELIVRSDNFTIRKQGMGKVIFAIVLVQSIFLLIYIIADGAGTRTIIFNFLRFSLSLTVGTLLSIAIVDLVSTDERK